MPTLRKSCRDRLGQYVSQTPLIIVITTLAFAATGCSNNEQPYELVSATKAFPDSEQQAAKNPWGEKFDLLRKVKLGIWECYVPDAQPNARLFCTKDGRVIVYVENNKSLEITVPTSKNGATFLALKDNNNDGNMDQLNYDGVDKNRFIARVVYDLNLDGEADTVLNFKDKTLQVRINDTWHLLESTDRDADGKIIYKVRIEERYMRVYPFEYPLRLEELP